MVHRTGSSSGSTKRRSMPSIIGAIELPWKSPADSNDLNISLGDMSMSKLLLIRPRSEVEEVRTPAGMLCYHMCQRIKLSSMFFGRFPQLCHRFGPMKRWRDIIRKDLKEIKLKEEEWYVEMHGLSSHATGVVQGKRWRCTIKKFLRRLK